MIKPTTRYKKPIRSLRKVLKKRSGRDNTGSISVRHKGGRHKRYYRKIDFRRSRRDDVAKVIDIEYDPNRTAHLALIAYEDGERAYILHPKGIVKGATVMSATNAGIKVGNCMPLKRIPLGREIHNIELYPGQGGRIVKSAGSSAVIIAKEGEYADVKLPSKEVRKIPLACLATLGQISNVEHKLTKLGKAGTKRRMGIRPTVRGVAQHPGSHPHGGGEGRSPEGMHPKTPWGKPARGKKTRKKKWSDTLIIRTRKQGRR